MGYAVSWVWERATGERWEVPEHLDVVVEPFELSVAVYESAARDGAWVDTRRARIPPRKVIVTGRMSWDALDQSYDSLAALAWTFSGGVGKFYRGSFARYLPAILTGFHPRNVVGNVWDLTAEFTTPEPFWLSTSLSTVSASLTPTELSRQVAIEVGGAWVVWPYITVSAVGAHVTNPKVTHPSGRYWEYSGTLSAGQTLVVDPVELTAKIGTTSVLGNINLSWFDPYDRLYLAPVDRSLTFSASSIGSGGRADIVLTWRRRWL